MKFSSSIFVSGTFPIDTTKTRLQIQGQKLDKNHANLKYRGMVDCFIKIAKQEGFSSLYSGYDFIAYFPNLPYYEYSKIIIIQ